MTQLKFKREHFDAACLMMRRRTRFVLKILAAVAGGREILLAYAVGSRCRGIDHLSAVFRAVDKDATELGPQ